MLNRMRTDPATRDYIARRTAAGQTSREIRRAASGTGHLSPPIIPSGLSLRWPGASLPQATSRTASTTWASVIVRAATTRPAWSSCGRSARRSSSPALGQDPADRLDRVALAPHGVDEARGQRLRGLGSLTKKTVADFKIAMCS